MQEFFINKDGFRIHAKLEFPDGIEEIPYDVEESPARVPLVIVIHGLTGHMEEPHIVAVAQSINQVGMAALRVELYGHGKADGAFFDHTIPEWVSELQYVIDYARGMAFVSDIYLLGHSQGGLTSILAAAHRTDCLKALLLLAPAINIRDGTRIGNVLGTIYDPELIPDSLPMWEETLAGTYFRTARDLPVEESIDAFYNPVLVIHADSDETVPYECGKKAAERYRNCRLVTIANDDHCYNTHLGQVLDAIRRFLVENR